MIHLPKLNLLQKLALLLFLVHFTFIFLAPLFLENFLLSLALPLIYPAVLFLLGFGFFLELKKPVPTVLLAGYLSQLPGIICAVIILLGKAGKFLIPEALDFFIQIWQAPFAPLFPFLPRIQLWEIPLYYLMTLALSFFLPLFPAGGALLKAKLSKQGRVN